MESMTPNGHPARGRDGAAFGGHGEPGGGPGDGRGTPLPALPVTWRPHRTRTIIYAVAAVLAGSIDRKSTRLNSSHLARSRMPSSA